jgi:hypothetical protein
VLRRRETAPLVDWRGEKRLWTREECGLIAPGEFGFSCAFNFAKINSEDLGLSVPAVVRGRSIAMGIMSVTPIPRGSSESVSRGISAARVD